MSQTVDNDAKGVLLAFLKENASHDKTKQKVREFFHRICFMQKKIRDYLVCRVSKVEVLLNYWEKIEFMIMKAAAPNSKKGKQLDKGAQDFYLKLNRVP